MWATPELRFGETSAAQNGSVIQTCPQCGAVNEERAETCYFCDTRLSPSMEAGQAVGVAQTEVTSTRGSLAIQPEWRREVTHRFKAYRARRRRIHGGELQVALPFTPEAAPALDHAEPAAEPLPPASAAEAVRSLPRRVERVEIAIPDEGATFSAAAAANHPAAAQPQTAGSSAALFAVASLSLRRRAALLDAAFLLFSYGGMLALFYALGGRITLGRVDIAITLATLALFYAQYFALFSVFGGSTPGMMVFGIRVVSFDGAIPDSRQMFWRSFGYLMSAGTFFLGFFWALWDEDHLCWQDRISQTYLTRVELLSAAKSSEISSGEVGLRT